jgi:hypothetical protein
MPVGTGLSSPRPPARRSARARHPHQGAGWIDWITSLPTKSLMRPSVSITGFGASRGLVGSGFS